MEPDADQVREKEEQSNNNAQAAPKRLRDALRPPIAPDNNVVEDLRWLALYISLFQMEKVIIDLFEVEATLQVRLDEGVVDLARHVADAHAVKRPIHPPSVGKAPEGTVTTKSCVD